MKTYSLNRRILLAVLSVPLWYVVGLLTYSTLVDYTPAPSEAAVVVAKKAQGSVLPDTSLSLLIWNVGYAGLGASSDFFYGQSALWSMGKDIRPEQGLQQGYEEAIRSFLAAQKVDFFLLQEVDRASRRSYFSDQVAGIADDLKAFDGYYFPNYRMPWVPVPLLEPWHAYGKVESGLATYSRYAAKEAVRMSLPGSFGWPKGLYMLDRCLGFTRFAVSGGHDLVLINIHNEAYDRSGRLKKAQLAFLKKILEAEYALGNYVIAGGDWNQCPPYFRPETLLPVHPAVQSVRPLPADFPTQAWRWVYDPGQPTNRSIEHAYEQGKTPVALIDFFLVSPNVRIQRVKTMNQGFRASDHQPVWMEVRLGN
ncbi:MAG: endonuclease/exonuclease/phosphatase family protein [Haliscomenobacter sp.]